jgi:uncharacterized alkaline shock family protein YloU
MTGMNDERPDIRKTIRGVLDSSKSPVPLEDDEKDEIIDLCIKFQYSTNRDEFRKKILKLVTSAVNRALLSR